MPNDVGYKTGLRKPAWKDTPRWEHSHSKDGLSYSQVEDMQPVHYVLEALARSWVNPRWRLNHMRESEFFGYGYRKRFAVIFENIEEHGKPGSPIQLAYVFPEEFAPMFSDQDTQNSSYAINGYGLAGLKNVVQGSVASFGYNVFENRGIETSYHVENGRGTRRFLDRCPDMGVVYVVFDLVDLRKEIDVLGEHAISAVQETEKKVRRLYDRKAALMTELEERQQPAKRKRAV